MMEKRQSAEIEAMKLEINSKGLNMNKAWVDLYETLKKYEGKLLVKEGDLVLRESNLRGREEGIVLEQSRRSSDHSDLDRALQMKEKQLRQFRREIGVKEAVLADQYKLIQQEKKEKEEFERKLEQVNFNLRIKELLIADLQKKMVNNSVALGREISELKIRLSVEKQASEWRKRKASMSTAVGSDPSEPKSPRFYPSEQHSQRNRKSASKSVASPTIETRPGPSTVKTEQNDDVWQRSASVVSNLSNSAESSQPESHLNDKIQSVRVKAEEDDDNDVQIIETRTSMLSSRPISSVVMFSSGLFSQMKSGTRVQHVRRSDGKARSGSSACDPSHIGSTVRDSTSSKKNDKLQSPAEDKTLSSCCSQIPTGTNSLDKLLTRLRMVQSADRRRQCDHGPSTSQTPLVADGASQWQELSNEPVITSCGKKTKRSVSFSSCEDREQTDGRGPPENTICSLPESADIGNRQADIGTYRDQHDSNNPNNPWKALLDEHDNNNPNNPWKALLDEYADTMRKQTAPIDVQTGVDLCAKIEVKSEPSVSSKSGENQNSQKFDVGFSSGSENDTGGICFGDVSVPQIASQTKSCAESDHFSLSSGAVSVTLSRSCTPTQVCFEATDSTCEGTPEPVDVDSHNFTDQTVFREAFSARTSALKESTKQHGHGHIYCKFCNVGFLDTSAFAKHVLTCSEIRSGLVGKPYRAVVVKKVGANTVEFVRDISALGREEGAESQNLSSPSSSEK